jgi:LysM repeat protein
MPENRSASRYNCNMRPPNLQLCNMPPIKLLRWVTSLILLMGIFNPAFSVLAAPSMLEPQASQVTAFDLIVAMNTLRTSNGLPALIEDPILDAVAQSTAEIMAANQMSWHIGNVSGRLQSAGYGGGSKVWATENFAVGMSFSIDQIMIVWSDASHMIPAVNAAYCNIGAGVAKASNGSTYYVLQAAYTSGKSCGEYTSTGGKTTKPGGSTDEGRAGGVSQLIVPVKIATPDAEGRVYHIVQPGQSFWSIAIAYKITIQDLETWNNLSRDSKLLIGQKLFIPNSNTKGYATPTPVGMVQLSTPDPGGKIIHTVQAYQTLTTIAQAYGVTLDRILALNGILVDWPLQIGQKLLIDPGFITPSPTPRPLTPIERLTPASDGKYYHIVKSGETLSWIAQLYDVRVADLMVWNGLGASAIIHPDEKLVLQVTPPATATPTLDPATATPTITPVPPTSTSSPQPSRTEINPTRDADPPSTQNGNVAIWLAAAGLIGGLFLVLFSYLKKQ